MTPARLLLRATSGAFAIAIVALVWWAWAPPPLYRAGARVEILDGAARARGTEVATLERRAFEHQMAVFRVDGTNLIEVSFLAADPNVAANTVNAVLSEFVHTAAPSVRVVEWASPQATPQPTTSPIAWTVALLAALGAGLLAPAVIGHIRPPRIFSSGREISRTWSSPPEARSEESRVLRTNPQHRRAA